MKSQNRFPRSKDRGSLIFAQNSPRQTRLVEFDSTLHPRNKFRGFFAQNKKAEKEFFDKFDREGGYDVLNQEGYKKILNFMRKKIKVAQPLRIADMGCGSGAFTSCLKKEYKNANIIGVDLSVGCIERAKRSFPGIRFVVDDVEKTKFKNGTFDVIWYSGILHHFPDFSKVANEAFRILKPGGFFFSYDPNYYNPAFWLYRHPKSPFYSNIGITSNERLLKASEIKNVFGKAGFETYVQGISGIRFRYVESKRTRSLLTIYNVLDQILGMTPFAHFIGVFTIGYGQKKG